jgi:hypothetical protein
MGFFNNIGRGSIGVMGMKRYGGYMNGGIVSTPEQQAQWAQRAQMEKRFGITLPKKTRINPLAYKKGGLVKRKPKK